MGNAFDPAVQCRVALMALMAWLRPDLSAICSHWHLLSALAPLDA